MATGGGTVICRRLRQRRVPFVVYTAYPPMSAAKSIGVFYEAYLKCPTD